MKYLSKSQILESLKKLSGYNPFFGLTFLAAKEANLPVGEKITASLDALNEDHLNKYFKLDPRSKYFFRVFRFNDANRFWVRPDYAGKGLQKLNTTSFKDAFLHDRNEKSWGWNDKYVDFLSQSKFLHKSKKIPAFHLSSWLFRNSPWPDDVNRTAVTDHFFDFFNITTEERNKLFSYKFASAISEDEAFDITPVNWRDIEAEFCPPPDVGPEQGGILSYLEMEGVGPVSPLIFTPGHRLNIITGDNGLGKTFLLEVAWWALAGHWAGIPALPRRYPNSKVKARIKYSISGEITGKPQSVNFSANENRWPESKTRATISGLLIYARVDGSFAVWDPAGSSSLPNGKSTLVFSREQVWDGESGRIEGLIRDWTKWQSREAKDKTFAIFKQVIAKLSPPELGTLVPSEPVRLPSDPREIPTIKHSYGDIPILHESAGVRRILTLAYLMVWAWNEHTIISQQFGKKPESRMVVIIDEIEAHLHPRWQRTILPAILEVAALLSPRLEMQLLVATHSPLVLASAEPIFDDSIDKLFHLETSLDGSVNFSEIPFILYGPVNSWLTSNIFQLMEARSKEAEDSIKMAIELQKQDNPAHAEIEKVNSLLTEHLPPEDSFWPRWVFFAENHGVTGD